MKHRAGFAWVVAIGIGLAFLLALAVQARAVAGPSVAHAQGTPFPTPTTIPFLQPPFARTYRVTSYFDHHFPLYTWDDTVVIFNGEQASAIDGITDRSPTFRGGYWLPETGWYVFYDGHNAFDYGTGAGTTILAAAPGEVIFADIVPSGCATPLQYVALRHSNGYRTYYLHLEGIVVRKGEWVETGDPLGISGNSGCSLGPHLHFAVEYDGAFTDPYGWQPTDVPDPLIEHTGHAATWLWAPEQPQLPKGRLESPTSGTKTNGELSISFVLDPDSPPAARVEFYAYYQGQWHSLGADPDGSDGWSLTWDTRSAPEGEVWLHAWAIGADGRVGKGSPILTDVTIDRHPPQGFIVGLMPESTVGGKLWLYAASYDPDSTTRQVAFSIRQPGGEWHQIGEAAWLHTSNWLLEWEAGELADGARFDVIARLTDGAGNTAWTEPVEGLTLDRAVPGGELTSPPSSVPFTGILELAFTPSWASGNLPPIEIHHVEFYVWYDGAWHLAGVDGDGGDGWRVAWDPTHIEDQSRIRVQARVYDARGRYNTALPQVTDLTLDRTPPRAGYTRPTTGGVARPDVDQRVWASDGGSGVDRVEFFVDRGDGWLQIGEDRSGHDGWSLLWDGGGFPDGILTFGARVYDRAGNSGWTTDAKDVAFDRQAPVGGFASSSLESSLAGTVTLTLDVADAVSGLDRAIFYAWYDGRWHHLGADVDPEDGFQLEWDTSALGERDDVTLTAWVYDRAGNYVELPHLGGLQVGGRGRLVALPTSTPSPSPIPSPTPSPIPSATPSPTVSPSPTALPSPTAAPSPTPTRTPTAPVPSSTPTRARSSGSPSSPSPEPTETGPHTTPPSTVAAVVQRPPPSASPMPQVTLLPPPPDASSGLPFSPAFLYLILAGLIVALALLILSIRNLILLRRL